MPSKLWFSTWFKRDIYEKPLAQRRESYWAFWKSHFSILSENQREISLPQFSLVIMDTFKDQDNKVLKELCVQSILVRLWLLPAT